MRGLHCVVPMGLLALRFSEFHTHELVCPFFHSSVPLFWEQKEREFQESGLARRIEGAGCLGRELEFMSALETCFTLQLKPVYCQTAGKSTCEHNQKTQRRGWP